MPSSSSPRAPLPWALGLGAHFTDRWGTRHRVVRCALTKCTLIFISLVVVVASLSGARLLLLLLLFRNHPTLTYTLQRLHLTFRKRAVIKY